MKLLVWSVPFTSHFCPRLIVSSHTSFSLSWGPFQASHLSIPYQYFPIQALITSISTAPSYLFCPISHPPPPSTHCLLSPSVCFLSSFHLPPSLPQQPFSALHIIPILMVASSFSPLYLYSFPHLHGKKKPVPTSILYYITSLGMIVLLVCLNVDRQSPFLFHPEFPLPECLKPKYWFLLFHLIGTL